MIYQLKVILNATDHSSFCDWWTMASNPQEAVSKMYALLNECLPGWSVTVYLEKELIVNETLKAIA